jgi:hypothetical protein
VHPTVSGAQASAPVNWPLSGNAKRAAAKIHRTVRWALDCLVGQRSAQPMVGRAISGRQVDFTNDHKAASDCPVRHWTVRRAKGPVAATVGFAK